MSTLTSWVNFQLSYTQEGASDPSVLVPQNQNTLIIDSINLTNSEYSSLIDVNLLRPYVLIHLDPTTHLETGREIQYDNPYLARNLSLEAFERKQLLKEDCLYLQPADYLTAQSDYFKHLFDGLVSYRELISPSPLFVSLDSLTPSKDPTTGIVTVEGIATSLLLPATLAVGDPILITGASPSTYNGVYLVESVDIPTNTFTYTLDLNASSFIDTSVAVTGSPSLLPLSLNTVQTYS